jgi:hypothetical protein
LNNGIEPSLSSEIMQIVKNDEAKIKEIKRDSKCLEKLRKKLCSYDMTIFNLFF